MTEIPKHLPLFPELSAESLGDEHLRKRIQLRTVMRIEAVKVYEDCPQADVEGLCATDHLCGTLAPCTLYFPLDTPDQVERFNRLRDNYRIGSYHWIDAGGFSLFDPDTINILFTEFTTEPAAAEHIAWLKKQFCAANHSNIENEQV